MAADTFTANLSMRLQGTGNNENAWGTKNNTDVIAFLDLAVAGVLSKSVAGSSNVTLTSTEALSHGLIFTGTLTGNINVIVPTQKRFYFIYNNTSGSFTLTVKTSAGTGILVTQGEKDSLYCDGTNVESQRPQYQGAVLDDLNTLGAVGANSEFLVGTAAGALAWESGTTARISMGVAIGSDVQAYDAVLDATTASFKTAYETKLDAVNAGVAASQAEMEAASSNTVAATPGRVQNHPGVCKGWCHFNDAGTAAIDASYNSTSLADNGTGDYTWTFATDMSSANYAAVATQGEASTGVPSIEVIARAASTVQVNAWLGTGGGHGVNDVTDASIMIFGDQ